MNRILVCLDGSPRAPLVLSAALDIARRTGAKIRLFRAVGIPHDLPPEVYVASPNDLPKILVAQAEKELTGIGARIPPELLEGVSVRVGQPWEAICVAAREQNVDLVVIGSHGFGGIDRLLGTTAAKVVNHADRSVLVVRPNPA